MIYQYNGYQFNRVYIQADSLPDAMSRENKKALLKEVLDNAWCADLDDVRFYYKRVFASWYDPSVWFCQTVFLDAAY